MSLERIQAIGNAESTFLKSLPAEERQKRYEQLFSYKVPCVVFSRNLRPDKVFLKEAEKAEVRDVFTSYGLSEMESAPLVEALSKRPQAWIDFMMRFELGLEKPDPKRALRSALTIAGSYIVGGLIPLSPYFFFSPATKALYISVLATLIALLVFGYVKGRFTGTKPLRSAGQTALIGGLAATAAFLIARLISR